ncbi:response regulator receiver protein [Caballeronia hypogeia]|uniref:Response regulator receiver protein n=1 Tax=Caballeronia hypogeia TaxID=1777140 RepID=A0A158ALK6_9BURK|nr:response regulator [Caballeronia hypogeia]SAK57917.1 response regulator receiver protein [Caballeronia hypogeia]
MSVYPHPSHCALWTNRCVDVDREQWRILVVDDNAFSAEALAAALESDGFDTRYAFSGVDALHAIDHWVPHVVILDITMPEHDGFATARVLRRIARTREAVIIAFTALGEEIVRPEGLHAGFDGYCQKGNPPAALVHLIARLVH